MSDLSNPLRPAWYQPDLFGDEWLIFRLSIHLTPLNASRSIGYEVVNAWTDEVLATGSYYFPKNAEIDAMLIRARVLLDHFAAAYTHE
jgi:hypothetical protein